MHMQRPAIIRNSEFSNPVFRVYFTKAYGRNSGPAYASGGDRNTVISDYSIHKLYCIKIYTSSLLKHPIDCLPCPWFQLLPPLSSASGLVWYGVWPGLVQRDWPVLAVPSAWLECTHRQSWSPVWLQSSPQLGPYTPVKIAICVCRTLMTLVANIIRTFSH